MAKAVRAKKSGVKTKAKKAARPAARKPAKAKKPAAKKTAAAKKAKPAAKKALKKTSAKKAPPKKVSTRKVAPAKAPARKAAVKPTAKAKAAPKPKSPAKPKAAPKPKIAASGIVSQQMAAVQMAPAAPAPVHPAVGQKAPDFALPADDGNTISLSGLKGRKVVLYFYPKDDTPGCTIEAIAFSAQKAAFEAAGAVVIGVSKDSIDDHCKFKSKHNLSIPLVSDTSGKMLETYGVWVEKNLYGRTYMGIDRTTFLIDGDGTVGKVWPKVKVEGHADEVLAAVKSL